MKPSYLLLLLLLPLSWSSHGAETPSHTRSAGKLASDSSLPLNLQPMNSAVIETSAIVMPRSSEAASQGNPVLQRSLASHPAPAQFELFDAWLELSGDRDLDGFYHRIEVSFDADADSPLETVYAKLYISYEGGPWSQYSSTELFEIFSDSANDTYQVATELVDGYPPGYYEVLIELHSLYHSGVVASRMLHSDDSGYAIALEDLQHDEAYAEDYYHDSYSHGVSGSISWGGLLMLGFILLIKLRYFRHNPQTEHNLRNREFQGRK